MLNVGDDLLSHTLTSAVPSALEGLASGFGMGPGVSLSLWSPKLYGDMVRTVSIETGTVPRELHSGREQCLLVPAEAESPNSTLRGSGGVGGVWGKSSAY